ncbi:MAG: DUF1207 domain-containing protein [Planctomycetia bacterium]
MARLSTLAALALALAAGSERLVAAPPPGFLPPDLPEAPTEPERKAAKPKSKKAKKAPPPAPARDPAFSDPTTPAATASTPKPPAVPILPPVAPKPTVAAPPPPKLPKLPDPIESPRTRSPAVAAPAVKPTNPVTTSRPLNSTGPAVGARPMMVGPAATPPAVKPTAPVVKPAAPAPTVVDGMKRLPTEPAAAKPAAAMPTAPKSAAPERLATTPTDAAPSPKQNVGTVRHGRSPDHHTDPLPTPVGIPGSYVPLAMQAGGEQRYTIVGSSSNAGGEATFQAVETPVAVEAFGLPSVAENVGKVSRPAQTSDDGYWMATPLHEYHSDRDDHGFWWNSALKSEWLPSTLLWEVPLANQREPRTFVKFLSIDGERTIDAAAGGQFGLVRWSPCFEPDNGVQIDLFAVGFARVDEDSDVSATDYRLGVPLTYAKGPWQLKAAYEHTSSHLTDEFSTKSGTSEIDYQRDDLIFGIARRCWDEFRVYGQAGFGVFVGDALDDERARFNAGVEWNRLCPSGRSGYPFAALDVDLRAEQDYEANTTLQVGWQWRPNMNGRTARLALELYTGRSPYGQFFRNDEEWVGGVAAFDW